jgi:hypothetical protein
MLVSSTLVEPAAQKSCLWFGDFVSFKRKGGLLESVAGLFSKKSGHFHKIRLIVRDRDN